MKPITAVLAPFVALCAMLSSASADPAFHVVLDTTKAPECQEFADKSKALVEEWYPKINEFLFGKDHPLPKDEITLVFMPMKGVANTSNAKIRISAEWVTKRAPNDYGMVAHELTHVVQDYKGKSEFWITEGIADYVRDRYFEPGVRHFKIRPESSYKQGYGIAAAFLMWLETAKNKDVVKKLNEASNNGTYKPEMFTELCGADVDTLWKEFVESQSKS